MIKFDKKSSFGVLSIILLFACSVSVLAMEKKEDDKEKKKKAAGIVSIIGDALAFGALTVVFGPFTNQVHQVISQEIKYSTGITQLHERFDQVCIKVTDTVLFL